MIGKKLAKKAEKQESWDRHCLANLNVSASQPFFGAQNDNFCHPPAPQIGPRVRIRTLEEI
jgi:hypothetical protein